MIFDEKYRLWWPEFETEHHDVCEYMIRRVTDVDVALKEVRTRGIAVQAGGHVGLFPRQLSKYFSFVWTFEAIPQTADCLSLNLQHYPNVLVTNAALGEEMGKSIFAARRSGRSRMDSTGDIFVDRVTIDSLSLPRCDLIYLDIEGSELRALAGAKETIEKYRPVIVLEVLKGNEEATMEWANTNKYTRGGRVHNDWLFTP